MATFFSDKDVDAKALAGKTVAIIGYGSQGHAHALNLRDSGVSVKVGFRDKGGPSAERAKADKFSVLSIDEAVSGADIVAILAPDMAQPDLYTQAIEPNLKKGATLLFAHGFAVHYKQIRPRADLDVVLVAPKGPGRLVRTQYQENRGVPCLVAVHQDVSGKALQFALAYAQGIGGTRAGVLQTTFAEETETDLFGEQAVLCGGATELVLAGFETLVRAGYQPEVAYFECLHELKLIVDLLYEGGLKRMHQFISETAKYGDLTRGPRVIDDHVKMEMEDILEEIQDGTFATEWVLENKAGKPKYEALMNRDLDHLIEDVGEELRARMSWIDKK